MPDRAHATRSVGRSHSAAADEWIARCYLPLRTAAVLAVRRGPAGGGALLLDGGEIAPVADDLRTNVSRTVRPGELLCLRMDNGVVVGVDFLDGRASLTSCRLHKAAERARRH
ncbi:MAG TPA: hypothetical protein VFA03_10295 [Acetobacteraceae bacterium]|nr:hypothetical protein [Acetobacteraceae bacterium]